MPDCRKRIVSEKNIVHVSKPAMLIQIGELLKHPLDCTTKVIYKKILENKTTTPKCLLNWMNVIDVEETQLNLAFLFSKMCLQKMYSTKFFNLK